MSSIERLGYGVTAAQPIINLVCGTGALCCITLGTGLKQVGACLGNIIITSACLCQSSVDDILIRLACLDGTNGTIPFCGRTVCITGGSSTPSAAGITARTTLIARGNTVCVN